MVFGTRVLKYWVLGPPGKYDITAASERRLCSATVSERGWARTSGPEHAKGSRIRATRSHKQHVVYNRWYIVYGTWYVVRRM